MSASETVAAGGVEEASAGVVVGVDGLPMSDRALDVALLEAALWQRPLTAVCVVEPAIRDELTDPMGSAAYSARARAVAEGAVARALARLAPAIAPEVTAAIAHGEPKVALAHAAHGAGLLVLGATGPCRTGLVTLGGTTRALVAEPPCPVLIVPRSAQAPARGPGRVVVAVDPSDPSPTALRWAQAAARRHAAPLLLVTAWRPRDLEGPQSTGDQDARSLAESALRRLVGDDVSETNILAAAAPTSLLTLVRPDDYLVLGSRGPSSEATEGLQWTSRPLLQSGRCTVILVPWRPSAVAP